MAKPEFASGQNLAKALSLPERSHAQERWMVTVAVSRLEAPTPRARSRTASSRRCQALRAAGKGHVIAGPVLTARRSLAEVAGHKSR